MTSGEARYSEAYLRYVMGIVFLIAVFNVMDRTVVSILMEEIKQDIALADWQLGLVAGTAFALVHVAAGIPIARYADRNVRKNVISVGLFVWSAMTAATGLATSFAGLLVARMGVGVGEAAGSPPSASLLSDYFPPERRARAMSMITIGALVGLGLGLVLGGALGAAYGWRIALIALGLPGIFVAVLVWRTVEEPPRGYGDGFVTPVSDASMLSVVKALAAIPSFRWIVVGACLMSVMTNGRLLWEPAFLMRSHGMGMAEVGFSYFAINSVPAAAGAWGGALWSDRLSMRDIRAPLWLCAFGNAASFPFIACFLLWPAESTVGGVPVAFLFCVVGSLLAGFFSPITGALAQNLSTPDMRALTHAVWTMAFSLAGMGIAPLVVGGLSSFWEASLGTDSLRYAVLVVASAALPSGVCYWLAARTLGADLARARAAATED